MLNALVAWGYDRTFVEVLAGQADANEPGSIYSGLAPTIPTVSAADAIGFGERRQITLPARVGMDLGGIAKGWTIQQAAYRLSMWGPCLVDAGGDIACMGEPPAGPWLVQSGGSSDTRKLDIAILSLTNQAVATSNRSCRRWVRKGDPAHHLIDPRTGAPAITMSSAPQSWANACPMWKFTPKQR